MSQIEPVKTSEWTMDTLKYYEQELQQLAEKYQLDLYPIQIEIINSEQMIDALASNGLPVSYYHWSFGKRLLTLLRSYQRGFMGLAYEIVINSNPCIVYLLEENTLTMQVLVMAHAAIGHNSFFKNNYLFQAWTSADAIIDYLVFAKKYIAECEEKYGSVAVEELLDSCHALMSHGVDKYRRSSKLSLQEEKARQKERSEYLQTQVNTLWKTLPKNLKKIEVSEDTFPKEPEENILYFIEKNSPCLETWQREIIRIVRKIAQYFYPQKQTKMMNEGWATFWHYVLMQELFDKNQINESMMIEFIHHHTNVIFQPPFNHPFYQGINPYTLGFSIFLDIRRICENPTQEDKEWFPDLIGKNWVDMLHYSMKNFKDESFIAQFLSPKVIRDLKLFSILDDDNETDILVSAIHNNEGYHKIRETLSKQYDINNIEPNIQIHNVYVKSDRTLVLRHLQNNRHQLTKDIEEVLKHIYRIWGFPVRLETIAEDGTMITETVPNDTPTQS